MAYGIAQHPRTKKWHVVDRSIGMVISDGHNTKASAESELSRIKKAEAAQKDDFLESEKWGRKNMSKHRNASVIQRGGKYYFKSFMGETGPYRSEPEAWRRGWTTAFKERNPAPKVKQGKWTPVHAVRFRRDGGVDLMY